MFSFLSSSYFASDEPSSWENRVSFVRFFFPFITIFLSSWLSFSPIPGFSFISPDYGLCVLYFWALYRPDLIPLGLLLGIGIMIDILSGSIIGMTPFIWFLAYGLVLSQRRFLVEANFLTLWMVFGVVFLTVHGVEWGTILILKNKWISPFPLGISFLLTLGVYPFISFLLSRVRSIFSLSFSDNSL